ncbi:hypothetical protein CPC08DRAFT_751791 [Agrocybe pediades]|nr:hypothetical protein CPC08DRAFT_751791 [Agrocybe pediades]
MQLTFFKLAVVFALTSVVKCDVIAFSGSFCDLDEGRDVSCNGDCHTFGNRHSLKVTAPAGHYCLYYYEEDGNCSGVEVGLDINDGNGQCTNVNTGTNVVSFRCKAKAENDIFCPFFSPGI